MPTLPVFHDEPISSLRAIMLFPNDLTKAANCAAWMMVEGSRNRSDAIAAIGVERLHQLALGAAQHSEAEAEDSAAAGGAAGAVVRALFAMIGGNPDVASWEHAIRMSEFIGARERAKTKKSLAVSKATLRKYLAEFRTVLHLWGAWRIRGSRSLHDPSVGYLVPDDVRMFVAESELLLRQLRLWDASKTTRSTYLGGDFFRVADDWRPPLSRAGWPKTGVVPMLTIDDAIMRAVAMNKAGRPRQKPL